MVEKFLLICSSIPAYVCRSSLGSLVSVLGGLLRFFAVLILLRSLGISVTAPMIGVGNAAARV